MKKPDEFVKEFDEFLRVNSSIVFRDYETGDELQIDDDLRALSSCFSKIMRHLPGVPHYLWKTELFLKLFKETPGIIEHTHPISPCVWLFEHAIPRSNNFPDCYGFIILPVFDDHDLFSGYIIGLIEYHNDGVQISLLPFSKNFSSNDFLGSILEIAETIHTPISLNRKRFPKKDKNNLSAPQIKRDTYIIVLRKGKPHCERLDAGKKYNNVQWDVSTHLRHLKSGKIITIRAYRKGPKDKPLKIKSHPLYLVKR